nr:restriction endonuclease subunit S [uncultured Pedobacter sp.]
MAPKYVVESSIIVLNQKCVRNNKIDYKCAQYIADDKQYAETKFLKVGDILVNSTGQGTAGRVAFVASLPDEKRVIVDSHILVLRVENFVEAQCLNYNLFFIEKTLQSFMDGSTGQGEFDKIRLFNIKVNYPKDSVTQQKIASVLSTLDDKIELNNKINDNLEQMAKTLYDYWFVQFDFPNAEGKPYKSSGGEMVYNDVLKREIPKGWEVKSLGDFIVNDKSGDWGKEESEGNYVTKVGCIRGADINGINGKGEIKIPTRFILEKNEHKILQEFDLVVEISGGSPIQSTGRLAYITREVIERFENPLICSNFCKAVALKSGNQFFFFVNSWNRAYDNGVLFGFEGKTSGIKNLLFDMFVKSYQVATPTENLLLKFQGIASLYEKKRQVNLKQNQELASLRDWLLPMLMNGQIKVE